VTTIGSRIHTARRAKRLSQAQLAQGICDRSYISQIEHDKVVPPAAVLYQLMRRLDLTWDDLGLAADPPERAGGVETLLAACRRLGRIGCVGQAFTVATEVWWTEVQSGRVDRASRVSEFLLSLTDQVDPGMAAGWLQSALNLHLYRGSPVPEVLRVGRRLQQLWFALARYHEAASLARLLLALRPDASDAIRILTGLGSAWLELDQREAAEDAYAKAASAWQAALGPVARGWPHHGLSAVHGLNAQWMAGQQEAMAACEFYQMGHSSLLPAAQVNLGLCLVHQGGQLAQTGLQHLDTALTTYHRQGNRIAWLATLRDCMEAADIVGAGEARDAYRAMLAQSRLAPDAP
jgi:tetratricopeptide (TPR) repeat protein